MPDYFDSSFPILRSFISQEATSDASDRWSPSSSARSAWDFLHDAHVL
jgi:hypothetical protein